MAKRHHSSHKKHHGKHHMSGYSPVHHERDEFNDEFHHAKGSEPFHSVHEYYAGPESRMRMEAMDGGMIREDRRAIANLPQEVMIKPYPMTGPYMPEGLDDTISGVDHQMRFDDTQRQRHFFPKKV